METKSYRERIDFFQLTLKRMGGQVSGGRFVVVGCGSGLEALCLRQKIPDAFVVGIDINRNAFVKDEKNSVDLVVGDATCMPFRNEVFDNCYCYHVLEHVVHVEKCIREIKRILKCNGSVLMAVPNARRLVGYISPYGEATLRNVIIWNLYDWLARFRGRFRPVNFHRGFKEEELQMSLKKCFPAVVSITTEYDMHACQGSLLRPLVKLLHAFGILRIVTVSHTFYCRTSIRSTE